jgi:thymidylate synthase (FAD)
MKVKLINYMPNMIDSMALAVSKCYDTIPKSTVVKGCIKSKHTSVTEHSMYVFEVKEVSRAFLAQITRHRHLQFTVRSQRYTEESNFDYIIPDSIANNPEANSNYLKIMEDLQISYNRLIYLGIPKEDARNILPNACHTELVVSGNYRAWMDFCRLRQDKHAQDEIREFAFEIDKLIHEVTPLEPFNKLFEGGNN